MKVLGGDEVVMVMRSVRSAALDLAFDASLDWIYV